MFDVGASTPYNSITHFRMDFGDGDVAYLNDKLARHVYSKAGQFIITLVVVDKNGRLDETYSRIIIGE